MKNYKNTLYWLVLFLPIGLYFYFLSKYAINIPKWDDHALKAFIIDFQKAEGFSEKLATFFKQHNEHRIAFDRLCTLIAFKLQHTIDYRTLMWIGSFTLLGLLFFFYKTLKNDKINIAFFVPIPFMLFQLELWENTFWGMASMQNFGILFFIVGLFYFVSTTSKINFYLALVFAFFATFTSGNGISAIPIAVIILLLQRRFKESIILSVVSVGLIFLYFYHYQMPPNNPPLQGIGLMKIALGYLSFLGSAFDLMVFSTARIKITILAGSFILILAVIILLLLLFNSNLITKKRHLSQLELFTIACLMFLLGTGIVVTFTRISFGEIGLLTSRYKIYSILALISIYTLFISRLDKIKSFWTSYGFIFIVLVFNILANYVYLKDTVNLRNQLISFAFNWQLEDTSIKQNQQKIYQIPVLVDNSFKDLQKPLKDAPNWDEVVEKSETEKTYFLTNDSFQNNDNQVFLVLQSNKKTQVAPAQFINFPPQIFARIGKYWRDGFNVELQKDEYESGTYHLGLWIQQNKKGVIFNLNDSLVINNLKPRNVKTNW